MAKGRYNPKNPEKYMGDPNKIIFRSSWELRAMQFFDTSPSILKWGSEEIAIPYIHPIKQKIARYFPDFLIVYKDKYSQIKKELLEIKPLKEVKVTKKSTLYDKVSISINEAKWKAATAFAMQHGMTFRILTEASIFKNKTPQKV